MIYFFLLDCEVKVQNSYKTPSPPHVKNGFLNNHVIISAGYNKCISTKKLIGKIKITGHARHKAI